MQRTFRRSLVACLLAFAACWAVAEDSVIIDGVPLDLSGRTVIVEVDGQRVIAQSIAVRVEQLPDEPLPESINVHGEVIPVQGHDGPRVRLGETRVLAEALSLDTLVVAGTLQLDRGAELRIRTLTVLPGGTLDLRDGSTIIGRDLPLDPADTDQWGNGFLCFGRCIIRGAAKTPFVRRSEPTPADWGMGDELLLPDPRQPVRRHSSQPQWRVEPRIMRLADSLFPPLPQAQPFERWANLTRGCVIRSENPAGTRWHVLFTGACEPDIEGCEFRDLGRTLASQVTGPNNPKARYGGPHLHHLHHPARIVDCVVRNGRKWGIVVHGSSGNTITGNVVYNCDGAGIVCEDGTERDNEIAHNFVCGINRGWETSTGGVSHPDKGLDWGLDGAGFWFRRGGNNVHDNVAANCGSCYTISGYYADDAKVPGTTCDWRDNEGYASGYGFWCALHRVGLERSTFGFRFWHISRDAVRTYHDWNCTFDIFNRGDPAAAARNDIIKSGTQPQANWTSCVNMGDIHYEGGGHICIIDSEGTSVGIVAPQETNVGDHDKPLGNEPTVVSGGRIQAAVCVVVEPPGPNASGQRDGNGRPINPLTRQFRVVGVDLKPVAAGRCFGLPAQPLIAWAWDRRGPHWIRPNNPSDVRIEIGGVRYRLWHKLGPPAPCQTTIEGVLGIVCPE